MEEDLLSKKEPRLHDFINSQPIQIAKDIEIRKSVIGKIFPVEKPGIKMGFSRKIMQKMPLSNGINSLDIKRRQTRVLTILCH